MCDWQSSLGKTGSHLASPSGTLNTVAINVYLWGGDRRGKKQIAVFRCSCVLGFLCSHVVWILLTFVRSQTHAVLEQCCFEEIASAPRHLHASIDKNVCLFIRLYVLSGSYNQSILMPATVVYTWLGVSELANWTRPGHFKASVMQCRLCVLVVVSYVLVSQINAVCFVKSV